MDNSIDLKSITTSFLQDLGASIGYVVRFGKNDGIWLPLASALRRYGFHDSKRDEILSTVKIEKMLIKGQLEKCIELTDFALIFAPFCRSELAQNFGVATINTLVVSPHQTGRLGIEPAPEGAEEMIDAIETQANFVDASNKRAPGFGYILSDPSSHFDVRNGEFGLSTDAVDLETPKSTVMSFLRCCPEWREDVMWAESGESQLTPQAGLALIAFVELFGFGGTTRTADMKMSLRDQIIESGADFGPQRPWPKHC